MMSGIFLFPVGLILRGLIRIYQWSISPLLLSSCRFEPSCSEYARQAIARHGAAAGIRLTISRLLRCHPWGASGFDPVPERVPRHSSSCRHG